MPGTKAGHDDGGRCLVRRDLDEARKLDLGLGDFRGPDADLRAVLPLQHQAGDQPLAVFQAVGELVILAVNWMRPMVPSQSVFSSASTSLSASVVPALLMASAMKKPSS